MKETAAFDAGLLGLLSGQQANRDEKLTLSNDDIDRKLKLISLDIRKEELDSAKQDREERKKFAGNIFKLLLSFLFASLIILSLSAIEVVCFHLSDAILITLLTTTTVNVIGIFLFVVRYLFKANNVCANCGTKITQTQTIES